MTTKPHADTRLAKFVAQRIAELSGRKTQAEIASEAGFANSNMISMIKSGATKLALDRVPQLSKALECDPAFLLRLALEQSLGATAAKSVHRHFRNAADAQRDRVGPRIARCQRRYRSATDGAQSRCVSGDLRK
jgi:transcriptional regulator with XRE-family HTH domain